MSNSANKTTNHHIPILALLASVAFLGCAAGPHGRAWAQPNEPEDAQEQADLITAAAEFENSPDFKPYRPDPRLSAKVATLQPLSDYYFAALSAIPCHFQHYNNYVPDRIFTEIYAREHPMFDARDEVVAFNHLSRHADQSLVDGTDCAILKVRLQQFKAATGFPSEW